jgi:SAM-dependent methyltransferase
MRRRLIRRLLNAGPCAHILDLGCGQGDLVAELREHIPGAELRGVDYSQYGVDEARIKVPGARFERRDLLNSEDPGPDMRGWATHAVCSEVLEHVDDPRALLANSLAYLAPGGRLVVTVPGGPISAFDRHIGHRRHFTTASLRADLVAAGYSVNRVIGAGFPFFNLYRAVVIVRGSHLAGDVGGAGTGTPSLPARAVMTVFRPLLAIPVPNNRLGWQIVGVAQAPDR